MCVGVIDTCQGWSRRWPGVIAHIGDESSPCCLSEVYNYKSCVAGEYGKVYFSWGARDSWQLIERK